MIKVNPSSRPRAVVRRLWPSDIDSFRQHLLRLDPRTRRDRFSGAVSDAFLSQYAEQAFSDGRLIFGCEIGGVVRGAAELCPFPRPHDDEAEAAFSVEEAYRLQGLGTSLFRRVLLAARNRGVRTLHVRCLPHNESMQALARKLGARLLFDGEEVLGQVEASPPTPLSILQEIVEASFDITFGASLGREGAGLAIR